MDSGSEEHDRRGRRLRSRREDLRRRSRHRRLAAVAALTGGLVALLIAVVVLGGGEAGEQPARIDQERVSALELNADAETRERQQAAIDEVLGYTPFLRAGRPLEPEVALTFDDGPGPYTDEILRILRRFDAPATFFVLGNMAENNPRLVRRQLRQGHAVGMHTYLHPRLGQMAPELQEAELAEADAAFRRHGLEVPRIFRPPYGSFDEQTVDLLDRRRQLMVLWSADTGDYENPGWDVIAERALEGARPGAVILLHDAGGDRAQTVTALPLILKGLRRKGLQPVTVPQLLVDNPPPRGQSLEQATEVVPPGEGLAVGGPAESDRR